MWVKNDVVDTGFSERRHPHLAVTQCPKGGKTAGRLIKLLLDLAGYQEMSGHEAANHRDQRNDENPFHIQPR